MDLDGGIAVVTGAASGIGLALTRACAHRGMRVAMADIEADELERTADALRSEAADVIAVPTDVSVLSEVQDLAETVFERMGPVSLLANNAGVATLGPPIWELVESDWRWVLGVNLFGVVNGLAAFLPAMVERNHGHIVNTASAAGLLSPPGMAPYVASKHAVVALSEALHHELSGAGSAVGVTVLCPGLVATRMTDNDRNRPLDRSLPAVVVESRAGKYGEMIDGMRSATEAARPADEVAAEVIRAVENDVFYVITDDWITEGVRTRLEDIAIGRQPTNPN